MGRSGGIRSGSGGSGTGFLDLFSDVITLSLPGNKISLNPADTLDMTSFESQFTDTETATISTPATVGAATLASCIAWYDVPNYSGSGNLLNSGTGGSALDMVASGGPTFGSSKFTMDGTDDLFTCANNALLNIAAGEQFCLGIVASMSAGMTSGDYIVAKGANGVQGYNIRVLSTPDTMVGAFQASDGQLVNTGTASALVTGQKRLFFVSGRAAGSGGPHYTGWLTNANFANYNIMSTASVGTITNTDPLTIGGRVGGPYVPMDVTAVFFAKRALQLQALLSICAVYGI